MQRLRRLILITFIESFATILVERAVYFYSEEKLAFSRADNLWLALAFGIAYVVGAMASHRLARRLAEKRVLLTSLTGQLVGHLLLGGVAIAVRTGWTGVAWSTGLFVGSTVIGLFNGLKWPLIESYISAGQGLTHTAGAIGRFNVAWASAVPLALIVAGPIIDNWAPGLFLLAGAINVASLALCVPLRVRPLHLPGDHADRPPADSLPRLRALLHFSRWTMLASYAALWVLAALMPILFKRLGHDVNVATSLSGLVDLMRLAAFVVLQLYVGWHGRVAPLLIAAVLLPLGFFMVIFGGTTWVVLGGEMIFGSAAGLVYYGALYYGMLYANAAVDAGGDHEGLIGLGFALGPVCGLLGVHLAGMLHGEVAGMLLGIGPMFLVCGAMALRSLRGHALRQ